jgi:hypothetical protein
MATIKSYSDLQQSKKLAKILPLESADMEYMFLKKDGSKVSNVPFVKDGFEEPECCYIFIPCWSLAALLGVIPILNNRSPVIPKTFDGKYRVLYHSTAYEKAIYTEDYDNPVDACVAMIIRLNELNLL